MRTLEQLKEEKARIISSQSYGEPFDKAQKRVKWLSDCILYLESSPSEEFLIKKRDQKQKELDFIDKSFVEWQVNTPGMLRAQNAKSIYNKIMGRQNVSDHLNALEYILS